MNTEQGLPILQTERLLLTAISGDDEVALFKMRSSKAMNAFTDMALDASLEDTRAYISKMNIGVLGGKWLIWAIRNRQDSKLLGTVSLWNFNADKTSAELGYGLMPDYQGQGYMRESLMAVLDYAFCKLALLSVEAYTEQANRASIKLLEALGFKYSETIAEKGYYSERIFSMAVYKKQPEA